MLGSVDEVVEAVGGTAAAAALAGVSLPAVSNWREREEIPAEYFLVFRDALASLGKDVDLSVFRFKNVAEGLRA